MDPRFDMSRAKRDDCIACDSDPVCNCAAGEHCFLKSRTCNTCPSISCVKDESNSGSSINPGAIAGPVVAALVIASLVLFWWLRKKKRRDLARLEELAVRAKKAESAGFHLSQPNSPQPPSAHSGSLRSYRASQLPAPPQSATRRSSQRSPLPPSSGDGEYRDENGATARVYRGKGTINLDPRHPEKGGDPFSDGQSFSTNGTSTHSTNVIPIQYISSSKADEGVSPAAKRLDEARQNLFKPTRPARSPDLDLRLNHGDARDPRSSEGFQPGQVRDSYLSETSGAPSFLSGNSYDVHNDAPKIVMSKQVQIGKFQQAEVVQFGGQNRSNFQPAYSPADGQRGGIRTPSSPDTFGSHPDDPSMRTLTPTTPGRYEVDMEEGLGPDEPSSAGSTDLRFSMGSLAYRDSMSSMGTTRYMPRPDSSPVPPPRHVNEGPRESMFSTRSYADSVLSGFPMIPPGQHGMGLPRLPSSSLPQSSSVATLDHAAHASPSRPPPAYRVPVTGPGNVPAPATPSTARPARKSGSRPATAASMADSFLGTFPFVPPSMDDMADLPSAALPSAAVPDTGRKSAGRNTMGMSMSSEGLGGFEFRVDGDAPPLPGQGKR